MLIRMCYINTLTPEAGVFLHSVSGLFAVIIVVICTVIQKENSLPFNDSY